MWRRVLVVVPAVSINFSLTYATTAIGIRSRFRLCASRPASPRSVRPLYGRRVWRFMVKRRYDRLRRRLRTRLSAASNSVTIGQGSNFLLGVEGDLMSRSLTGPAALAADPAGTDTLPATKVVL
jgi:hypothetical protein